MYMFEIIEQAKHSILLELSSLDKSLEEMELTDFSTSKVNHILYLNEIIDMIYKHEESIHQYSKKFSQEIDDWLGIWLTAIYEKLYKALELLEQGIVTQKHFDDFKEHINQALLYWEEKYIEDFECWLETLASDTGLHLSKYITVYNEEAEDQAFVMMLSNARIAEQLFFSLDGETSERLINLKNVFLANRRNNKKNSIIDLNPFNGYQIISSAANAIKESISHVTEDEVTSTLSVGILTGWNMIGPRNGNHEKVMKGTIIKPRLGLQPIKISYQHQPSLGNLANLKISGVGSYMAGYSGNHTPHILQLFNLITGENAEYEKKLALLLMRYKSGDSMAFTEKNLQSFSYFKKLNNKEKNTKIVQLNKAAFLICFQESWRRKNQGFRHSPQGMERVPELPFDIAIVCALPLLHDGRLCFKEVFDADAKFGVFTGQQIMSRENLRNTMIKFNRLFVLFIEEYGNQFYEVFEFVNTRDNLSVIVNPEYFHQILKSYNGGERSNATDYPEHAHVVHSDIDNLCKDVKNLAFIPPNSNLIRAKRF